MSSPLKPSQLSLNSRASPFRRPGSPLPPRSPSALRPSSSHNSPFRSGEDGRPTTPSRLSPTKDNPFRRSAANDRPTTPNGRPVTPSEQPSLASPVTSPLLQRKTASPGPATSPPPAPAATEAPVLAPPRDPKYTRRPPLAKRQSTWRGNGPDPLAHIPPALLHSMRESFSVLDCENTGVVTAADVQEALSEVGMDNGPASVEPFFPAGAPSSLNLASYLTMMASLLQPLSREREILAAFEAFDDQDDGQIDVSELTEALLNTTPEAGQQRLTEKEIERIVEGFRGRRALGKKGKGGLGRGDVFRYKEFVGSVCGGGSAKEGGAEAAA
ncbi:uncharacterized protein K452DRAFT_250337 [Aplosporella prunicola CBS 121167]|uniref:EF-hand domain-containing protein n=1 Tax=Aplosporella prunicola CBS 121167 TaxID=1176127 RepID=A0A6A6BE24_9PEZI|nr:uncharacterized protein K452DRAFT_250337 [Aplosporella prunicola CBS 121167]KAF2141633.1 hypothetical protein K452DRAFT_250337 [Aplosporella prunicola CBS 121167]